MRRPELLLATVVVAFGGFVAVQAAKAPRRAAGSDRAVVDSVVAGSGSPATAVDPVPGPRSPVPARGHAVVVMETTERRSAAEIEDVRRRIRLGAPGTWMGEVLLGHDSLVVRWPDRLGEPLRVWVAPGRDVRNHRAAFDAAVREAFSAWTGVGLPVRFTFVPDSARADIPITWVERFTEDDRVGVTHLRGRDGEITAAAIVLATHTRGGHPLDEPIVRAVALHEVGHLLGLPHTAADTSSVMLARASVRGLSATDRATARLLYTLPAGTVK